MQRPSSLIAESWTRRWWTQGTQTLTKHGEETGLSDSSHFSGDWGYQEVNGSILGWVAGWKVGGKLMESWWKVEESPSFRLKLMEIDGNWWKLMEIDGNWWKLMEIDEMKCIQSWWFHLPKSPAFGHGGHGCPGFGLARRRAIQTPSGPNATERAAPPRPGVPEEVMVRQKGVGSNNGAIIDDNGSLGKP